MSTQMLLLRPRLYSKASLPRVCCSTATTAYVSGHWQSVEPKHANGTPNLDHPPL